jgi:hypothetical protein
LVETRPIFACTHYGYISEVGTHIA